MKKCESNAFRYKLDCKTLALLRHIPASRSKFLWLVYYLFLCILSGFVSCKDSKHSPKVERSYSYAPTHRITVWDSISLDGVGTEIMSGLYYGASYNDFEKWKEEFVAIMTCGKSDNLTYLRGSNTKPVIYNKMIDDRLISLVVTFPPCRFKEVLDRFDISHSKVIRRYETAKFQANGNLANSHKNSCFNYTKYEDLEFSPFNAVRNFDLVRVTSDGEIKCSHFGEEKNTSIPADSPYLGIFSNQCQSLFSQRPNNITVRHCEFISDDRSITVEFTLAAYNEYKQKLLEQAVDTERLKQEKEKRKVENALK